MSENNSSNSTTNLNEQAVPRYLEIPVFVSRGKRPYVNSSSPSSSLISMLTVRGKVFIVVSLIAILSCGLLFWL